MNNSISKFQDIECPVWMKDMLDNMIIMANDIFCMSNPADYFNKLFGKYKSQIIRYRSTEPIDKTIPKFLAYAECRIIYTMFNTICDKFVKNGVLFPKTSLIDISDISANDILSIRCPTIFTSYHFIFAVVDKNAKYVYIYQSFGNRKLYRLVLPLEEFKINLQNMHNIKNYPKEQALNLIKEFEKKIYDNDFDQLFDKEVNTNNDDSDINLDKDELIDEYYQRNIIQNENQFQVDIFKFNHTDCPTIGGKRKTYKKKYKKNKTSKRKRNKNKLR
jgi:hypothetical protein